MDLYRYFHPHHNPRLRSVQIRLQELCELKQSAEELKRAIERAEIRAQNAPRPPIKSEHFKEILTALDYVVESLGVLEKAHPGDDDEAMKALLSERADAPGWENWGRLVKQRLSILESSVFEDKQRKSGTDNI